MGFLTILLFGFVVGILSRRILENLINKRQGKVGQKVEVPSKEAAVTPAVTYDAIQFDKLVPKEVGYIVLRKRYIYEVPEVIIMN